MKRPDREWWTIADLAELWHCSPRSIRRLIDAGELTAHKLAGHLQVADIERLAYERRCAVIPKSAEPAAAGGRQPHADPFWDKP